MGTVNAYVRTMDYVVGLVPIDASLAGGLPLYDILCGCGETFGCQPGQ
jgi:hypothetical protein